MKKGERMNGAYSFLSSQMGQNSRIFYDGSLNAKLQGWKYEFWWQCYGDSDGDVDRNFGFRKIKPMLSIVVSTRERWQEERDTMVWCWYNVFV